MRQLRLRDIGGIIVIDFIDMARARNRDKVLKTLRKALDADKSKSYVVEVSPLGLVEMTRQNVTDGVREILTAPCPDLRRRGRRPLGRDGGPGGAAQDARHGRRAVDAEAFLVRVNPKVAAELIDPDSGLAELEDETGKHFHFEGGDALSIDTFDVVESGTREEIEERALPFKVGEEVLVKIDEPHMYNADDAVARIDSYIVSVTGGGRFVGERKLVRIEEVERGPPAIASLLGSETENGGNGAGDGEGDDSELESALLRANAVAAAEAVVDVRAPTRAARTSEHVRSSRKRWQAVQGREGHVPARRSPRCQGGRQGRPAPGDVPRQGGRRRARKSWRRSKSRRKSPSTCAGRRSKSSNTRPKKGYRRRAGHRSELTRLEVTELKMRQAAAKKPAAKKPAAKEEEAGDGS